MQFYELSPAWRDPGVGAEKSTGHHEQISLRSPDAHSLATATNGKVHLWNVATGEEITVFATGPADRQIVRFSSDGRKLAAITFDPPIGNVFTLHYLANPTGPFAPNGGGSASPSASPAAATPAASAASTTSPLSSATGTIMSGLSFLNSGVLNYSPIPNPLQHVLSSPPVTKAIQTALHDPQLLQAVEKIASQFNVRDDAIEGLLKDLGLE